MNIRNIDDAKALFDICELAQTAIYKSQADNGGPPALFSTAERFKDELLIEFPEISGTIHSDDYTKAEGWLIEQKANQ